MSDYIYLVKIWLVENELLGDDTNEYVNHLVKPAIMKRSS